jgi:hypothetical protein
MSDYEQVGDGFPRGVLPEMLIFPISPLMHDFNQK